MDSASLQRLRQIILEVLSARPEERNELLDRACGDDHGLRAEAIRLLQFDDGEPGLDRPEGRSEAIGELSPSLLSALNEAAEAATPELTAGDRVGRFRVVRHIAQGGMAAVYLAERADQQFEQRVALKLLRIAGHRETISRFEQERQILATLNHPNISRLLDGGVTRDNQPYIVMEFVEGSRIDAYCDANELSVRDRIQLFLAVCRAVRYAHQNLIVHRDLKPSNIFVTADGEVKLLDFGIAKLLDAAPHPYAAPPTRTAIRLMTPEYASPEQVRGEPVTTASDVYQLGLLLYELLTGHNPQRAVAKNATELEREVSDTEPPRASGETLTSIRAQARRTTPRRIRKLLRGDVDNIIAKALQRNPLRRYASTDPLIEDLERHLDGRPVSARPDSIGYRMGRFMKRHRVGVTVAAIFVLLLGAYGVTITVLFSRVRKAEAKSAREARKATRTADFLTDLFAAPDPRVARSEVPTARDLLDAGAARIQTELADEPEVRAVLQRTMAISYGALGLLDVADSLLEASLEIQEDQLGEGHIEVGTTKFDLAVLRYRQSRLAECKELARGALAIYEKERGPNDQDVASICELLALSLEEDEKEEAEQLLSRSLSIREAAEEPDPVDITGAQYKLGLFYRNQNRPEEAARYYSLALEGRRKVAEPDDPAIATMASALGGLYTTLKRYEEAEPLLEEARSIREKTLGTQHTGYASTLQALGKLRWAQDRHQEALALSREATRIVETNLPDSRLLARYLLPLADLEAEMELYEDAEGHYRQAIGIFQKVAPQSSFHSQARQQLAAMLRQLGRDREADEFESQLVSTRQD